jgi:hypothetical protein
MGPGRVSRHRSISAAEPRAPRRQLLPITDRRSFSQKRRMTTQAWGATFAVQPGNAPPRPGDPAPRRLLFGRNYQLFPTGQFRCYFEKIPLLFHCSEKRLFGRKPLKLLAGRAPPRPDFFKNSLLIPLLPQIAERFQRDGESGRRPVAARCSAPYGSPATGPKSFGGRRFLVVAS